MLPPSRSLYGSGKKEFPPRLAQDTEHMVIRALGLGLWVFWVKTKLKPVTSSPCGRPWAAFDGAAAAQDSPNGSKP